MKGIKTIILCLASLSFTSCSLLGSIGEKTDDDKGSETLKYDKKTIKQNILELAKPNGLEISVIFYTNENGTKTEDESIVFGVKDNTYWYCIGDQDGVAYKYENDNYAYRYSMSSEGWYYTSKVEISEIEENFDGELGLTSWAYVANSYNGMLKKTGTSFVLNRNCDMFEYKVSTFGQNSISTYAVDQQTGMTLKSETKATILGFTAITGFEVTSIKTNGVNSIELSSAEE